MKPGLVGGAACGALIFLLMHQIAEVFGGNVWALPGMIWDAVFATIGIWQIFCQPAYSPQDTKND